MYIRYIQRMTARIHPQRRTARNQTQRVVLGGVGVVPTSLQPYMPISSQVKLSLFSIILLWGIDSSKSSFPRFSRIKNK